MTNQCFWISIRDWFNIKNKKLKDLVYKDDKEKAKINPNNKVSVTELKKAFGCKYNEKGESIEGNCNNNNNMIDFVTNIDFTNQKEVKETFNVGIDDFAKRNKIYIRIFYMSNNHLKINIPNDNNWLENSRLTDYGDIKDINNSIWIYATTNHFELITNYDSHTGIKYDLNTTNSTKIDGNNSRSYNSKNNLVKITDKLNDIYIKNEEIIRKIVAEGGTQEMIQNKIKEQLKNYNDDDIEKILVQHVMTESTKKPMKAVPKGGGKFSKKKIRDKKNRTKKGGLGLSTYSWLTELSYKTKSLAPNKIKLNV